MRSPLKISPEKKKFSQSKLEIFCYTSLFLAFTNIIAARTRNLHKFINVHYHDKVLCILPHLHSIPRTKILSNNLISGSTGPSFSMKKMWWTFQTFITQDEQWAWYELILTDQIDIDWWTQNKRGQTIISEALPLCFCEKFPQNVHCKVFLWYHFIVIKYTL